METATHLTDHVFPRLPARQWVLLVHKRLRDLTQLDGAALNIVLRIFLLANDLEFKTHCCHPTFQTVVVQTV